MIPFYRPAYNHLELVAALRPGPARREFESAIAAHAGARYAITFAYGHVGLIAAFKVLGLTQAEVILPAYTCIVMARAVVASGNRPVFVDIDLADYNMDVSVLKRALTPQTRAVVATHMYGYPTDVDAIRATVGDERIIIVEDSALSLHTLSAGGGGLRGDLGLFSLGIGKPISTFKGGVIVTNSSDLYEKIKAYRDKELNQSFFRTRAKRWLWLLASYLAFREGIYGLWHRAPAKLSRNVGLENLPPGYVPGDIALAYPDFQARVGLVQLRKVDSMLAQRRALAELYDRELRNVPGLSPAPIIPGATYAYYTLRVNRRDEINFPGRMLAQSVATDQTYDYALPLLKPYRSYARGEYPRAAQAAREVVNLPIYPGLSTASARYVAESTRRAFRESFQPQSRSTRPPALPESQADSRTRASVDEMRGRSSDEQAI
jgi:perosamine synthetase